MAIGGRSRFFLEKVRVKSMSTKDMVEPMVSGWLKVHPAGYGFVLRDDGEEDVFVPAKYRGHSLDGDKVQLYTWDGHKGTEGRVEEVLERGRSKLTGTLVEKGKKLFLVPDDPRISIDFPKVLLERDETPAPMDSCVVVEIVVYPKAPKNLLVGRILRVLGPPDDPNTEIEKILVTGNIPTEFTKAAISQAEATSQTVNEADFEGRLDLRDKDFLTIDPVTARDFDDALCIEKGDHGGNRVWVAVADVSHYVRPGDALDVEAVQRGVSVYLPDRVVPMLPMQLSSGICSLNPDVERCAMVVKLEFDGQNHLVETDYAAAVIKSKGRLDYPGVAAALAGDFTGPLEKYRQWIEHLKKLHHLAQVRRKERKKNGTLELDIPEPKVILDADDPRLIRNIVRSKGQQGVKSAYELVEEFMIAANEAVGRFFASRNAPSVWRVHAPPKEDRVFELADILSRFDITVDAEEALTPAGMKKVLKDISPLPASRALSFLVLRSLTQAAYETNNVGHFGLASKEYIHFTSPIRRYPDLIVHRLMKEWLRKENKHAGPELPKPPGQLSELEELGKMCSLHERRAVDVEREAVAMYRAFFMRDRVGEECEGQVSGVTQFGAFVEIDDPFVEGLIKLESIGDDYYEFDSVFMTLSGKRSGHSIGLGDRVTVEIINASITQKRIELRLVEGGRVGAPKPKRQPRKKRTENSPRQKRRESAKRNKSGRKPKGPTKKGRKSKGRSLKNKGKSPKGKKRR